MQYMTTDAMTGIAVTAEQEPNRACTVTLWVPTYDGTDDEHALRMQARAGWLVLLALDAMSRAMDIDRAFRRSSRSVGRDMWQLVARTPRWLDVRGVVACPASLC